MDCFEEDQFLLEHYRQKMPTFLVGKYFIMMSNKATKLNKRSADMHQNVCSKYIDQ